MPISSFRATRSSISRQQLTSRNTASRTSYLLSSIILKIQPSIVPIIIGTDDENTIKKIAEALSPYFIPENLFVISSDFSHYPSYQDAVETDKKTALGIISGSSKTFLNTLTENDSKRIPGLATSMCGWTSGLTLLYLTEGNKDLEISLIDYCNSGDSSYGGKNEVVGYNAIAFFDKRNGTHLCRCRSEFLIYK